MKKLTAVLMAVAMMLMVAAQAAQIEKTEYEGFGYVEVDFINDVRYTGDVQVTVTDVAGTHYTATVQKMDDDDLTFKEDNIVEDQVYNYTISGIEGDAALSGEFYASALKSSMIEKVEYDVNDRELDIDFNMDVRYDENSTVTVTDAAGSEYATTILEKDSDSIEARVEGLTPGETYTITITGIAKAGENTFETYSREFVAIDR